MKFIRFFSENILFILTLFLLSFIPLYPKLPLLDIKNTWVYVRLEDFIVAFTLGLFAILWIFKKATLKLPITIPILIFWGVGLLATILGIAFFFSSIQGSTTNVAIFSFLRRVEYISLAFVGFNAFFIQQKTFYSISPLFKRLGILLLTIIFISASYFLLNNAMFIVTGIITPAIWIAISVSTLSLSLALLSMLLFPKKEASVVFVILLTVVLIVLYGLGEKYFGVPAYLTMNEEFAKGIPLRLSALARVPSTFAGHYDLAAYLVLIIPLLGSLVFGYRKWYMRILFFIGVLGGLALLLLTASRVSFAVYLVTISFMLLIQKKKLLIIPVIILSILFSTFFQGITQRFSNTISQVDLVVDARTGKAVGIAKEGSKAVVIEDVQSTGENLPKGTAYIKLPAAKEVATASNITLKRNQIKAGTTSAQITNIQGDFVVQKVLAYDVSFTTRFQGEWPRAIEAFKRNILFGSGYSSISLATDNNYLRILGEIGLVGLLSFFAIFLVAGIYVKNVLPQVTSPLIKSIILGTIAGIFGLSLNAILIDVFEASKVAFVLWLLIGVCLGMLQLYQKNKINYLQEIKNVLISIPAIAIYLLLLTFGIFSMSFNNFFVGDDFTWLRWAADCTKVIDTNGIAQCQSTFLTVKNYFLEADGFFYRPGTKLYFLFMYAIFGLNANMYHIVSILLHYSVTIVVFLLAIKLLKNKFFAMIVALFFLLLSVHAETIFWISAVGHIIAAGSILLALLFYIYWKEEKQWIFLVFSFVSTIIAYLFHEIGIITPLLILFYDMIMARKDIVLHPKRYWPYIFYFATIPLYLWVRSLAKSHWLSGDYNYNLSNLPFNVIGNIVGYVALIFAGSPALFYYEQARTYGKTHEIFVGVVGVVIILLLVLLYKFWGSKFQEKAKRVIIFASGFFVIALLLFLGLGNITTRYAYLPSVAILILFVYAIQNLYMVLTKSNKIVGIVMVSVVIGFFCWYQYSQLQKLNTDWHNAGEVTSQVMKNFNDVFQVAKITPQNPVFYFVNVPIRKGEAWIFPVGLPDALWFTFQNENLTVKTTSTLNMALDASEGSTSARVFEFKKNGDIEEVVRSSE